MNARRAKALVGIIAMISLLLTACGGIYTNVKTPTPTLNIQVNADRQSKVGRTSAQMFLWVVYYGDCSIATAMKDGAITKIHHVDSDIQSYLFGLYGKYTTVVYGE
ncbi:MAG: TRL-like family protein [Syntrophales bacterium]|jgi:hypothetical protein